MQETIEINKTFNEEDLFPDTKKYKQIDFNNQLNQARYNYVLNLFESGLDIFLMELEKISDIDLFAKFSAHIIKVEKDQIDLLEILYQQLENRESKSSQSSLLSFYQAFLASQILIRSEDIIDTKVLPPHLRVLYLNLLPYKIYLFRSQEDEDVLEVSDLYWENFILCPTIKLCDLTNILPKLLKAENNQKIIEVIDYTFKNSGVIFSNNLHTYINAIKELELSKDDKDGIYSNLADMLDYLYKTETNNDILINLELSIINNLDDFGYNFEFHTIFNTVFTDNLKFFELYEKSLPPYNSKTANYLLQFLVNNKKTIYRFDMFYLNQQQFGSWYKKINTESKNKDYFKDLQYFLGSLFLNFSLNEKNIPNYQLLEVLDSIENRSFLQGYCDNQVTSVLNDVNTDLYIYNIDITDKLTENDKIKIEEIYAINAKDRIEEIEVIILRAELAGFYNIPPYLKKAIKEIENNKIIIEEDLSILRNLQ